MMATRRRARPAMYELMKGQRIYGPTQSHAPVDRTHHELDHEPAPTVSWLDKLRAGRALRIPVGYLFVTIPAVLLIVVVAYIFGFSRGETTAETNGTLDNTSPEFAVNDPLGRPLLPEQGNPTTNNTNRSTSTPTNNARSTAPATSAIDMSRLGPITSDPRQLGVTYFVLAETNPDGAVRLADFCRQHGLAAFVVTSRSDRFRKVIVLPGFDAAARSTEPVKNLENLIREVGRKWKAAEPGATDLSDAYPQTFKG